MANNCFSNWKILCAKEAIAREQHTSTKSALRNCPKLTAPLVTSFLTKEQVMYYLVTEKIK